MTATRKERPLDPIGLSKQDAADYVGISATHFATLVDAGILPRPKALGGRRIWDRRTIDKALEQLPEVEPDMKSGANGSGIGMQ